MLTAYNFKRHAIQESIYGVDIDPGAVDIAKLRLWLSLVVDEDDFKTIKPLPNLDYKIVCGDSLSSVNILFHHAELKELERLKGKYFEETNPRKKIQFKEDIDNLIREITNNVKHFDFKVYFSEVFNPSNNPHFSKGGVGGFDIVIANPPYVRHEAIKELKPELKKEFGDFYCGTADIYTYFYKKGIDLLKSCGHLCFIAPNKFMRAGYGKNTRKLLATQVTPKVIIDFCDLPIFDATTYPSIILVEKTPFVGAALCGRPNLINVQPPKEGQPHRVAPTKTEFLAATFTNAAQLERLEETLSNIGFSMPISSLREEGWNLERPEVLALMEKLRKAGTPLGEYVQGRFYRGITTGLNEAFVIDNVTKAQLISEHPSSDGLLEPFLRGKDVKRWKATFSDYYLIKIESSENIQHAWSGKPLSEAEKIFKKEYPAIHAHFERFRERLIKRDDQGKYFWELRSCAYWNEFKQPKIILGRFMNMNKATFTFDKAAFFHNDALYMIAGADEYVVAILNSTVAWWFITKICTDLQNGYLQAFRENLFQVPVFIANDKQRTPIIKHVEAILENPDSPDVTRLEAEINKLVYDLYNLTQEEIEIVEGKSVAEKRYDC